MKLRQARTIIEYAMMDFAKRIALDSNIDTKPEWMPDDIFLGATRHNAIIMVD